MHIVLVAYDGSPSADNALRYILDLVKAGLSLELHLLNVQNEPEIYGAPFDDRILREWRGSLQDKAEDILVRARPALLEAGIEAQRPAARLGGAPRGPSGAAASDPGEIVAQQKTSPRAGFFILEQRLDQMLRVQS